MDRACGTSKYPHNPLVTRHQFDDIQGYSSKTVKPLILGSAGVLCVLSQIFLQKAVVDV